MDLGLYRIIYAVATLLTVPDIQWVTKYPDAAIHAPLGPLLLISGFPSSAVLVALEVLRSFALALLAVGLWTRFVSVAVTVLLLATYGLTYTLGKIDHTILIVLAPLILSFAHWGRSVSIDALLSRRASASQPQWPLRFLALVVGLSFFAAAFMKFATGWLSPTTQAALGHILARYYSSDSMPWSVQWVPATTQFRLAWEVTDWLTVAMELAILFTVPWWRAFRIALAAAVLFHLGVLLATNIVFSFNVVVYGAFVSWAELCRPLGAAPIVKRAIDRFAAMQLNRGAALLVALFAFALSGVTWFVTSTIPAIGATCSVLIILAGTAVGVGYLLRQAVFVAPKPIS